MPHTAFLNTADDIQWLKDTHLRGVILPSKYAGFQSAILQGNEDAPYAVNLYVSADPVFTDDYYRVRFVNDGTIYAQACEYDGVTDKPYGGLSPLK